MAKSSRFWLHVGDIFISLFLISTLTVFYWRGTWKVLDLYLFPGNLELSGWVSFAVGETILLFFYFIGSVLDRWITGERAPCLYPLAVRTHNFVQGFGIVSKWRGIWHLVDVYSGVSVTSALVTLAVGCPVLCLLRSFTNVSGSPAAVLMDTKPQPFLCTTRFMQTNKSPWKFTSDILFTVTIIHSLIVVHWRGTWTLMDRLVYPESTGASGLVSLLAGYAAMALAFVLQVAVKEAIKLFEKKKLFIVRLFVEDLLLVLISFGTINVWRGVWYLADSYILPGYTEWSVWLTSVVGFVGLLLFNASGTVLAKGCVIDGSGDGHGDIMPIDYLKHYLSDDAAVSVSVKDANGNIDIHVVEEKVSLASINNLSA